MKKLRLSSMFVTKNIMKKRYCLTQINYGKNGIVFAVCYQEHYEKMVLFDTNQLWNDRFYRSNTVKIEMLGEGS